MGALKTSEILLLLLSPRKALETQVIPLSCHPRQSSLCCDQKSCILPFQPPLTSIPPGISSKVLLTARAPRREMLSHWFLGLSSVSLTGRNGYSLCPLPQQGYGSPHLQPSQGPDQLG